MMRLSFDPDLTLAPMYHRTKVANIRCFPRCSPEAHYENSFCGDVVRASLHLEGPEQATEVELIQCPEYTFCFLELVPWDPSKQDWLTQFPTGTRVESKSRLITQSPNAVVGNVASSCASTVSLVFVPKRKWALACYPPKYFEKVGTRRVKKEEACIMLYLVRNGMVVITSVSQTFLTRFPLPEHSASQQHQQLQQQHQQEQRQLSDEAKRSAGSKQRRYTETEEEGAEDVVEEEEAGAAGASSGPRPHPRPQQQQQPPPPSQHHDWIFSPLPPSEESEDMFRFLALDEEE